jgi:hypothetical protein
MTRTLRTGLLVLALAGAASIAAPVSAWTAIDSSQPTWAGTVPYQMQNAGSADLGADASEMIVMQAMTDWTTVSCTSLRSSYGGRTPTTPRTGDGVAEIGWVESSWRYDSSAIGVTQPQWYTGGGGATIQEADMELNGVNFTWISGSGSGSRVNAYSIVLHEGGHYYGMGHSSDPSATMYYAYSGGIDSLVADDQNGICTLYPGGTGTDCHTTGCSTGDVCQADGTCAPRATGDGGMCASCMTGADCTMGVCLGYPDGLGYCGVNCGSTADCASGDTCYTVTGVGGQCVRVVGSEASCAGSMPSGCRTDSDCASTETCQTSTGDCIARPAGGALGAPCGASSECSSGLCLAGACSQTCNWLDPVGGCGGAGFYCNGQATGTCDGTGLCQAGSPGGGALGADCSVNTDCASLFCAEGSCSAPCIPGGASTCADGFACQVLSTASCGSCQQTGQLGDPCNLETDCASRLCVELNGDRRCSVACDPMSDSCPAAYSCMVATGGAGVCIGDGGGLGAECASADDCNDHLCAMEPGSSYCTRECSASSPCQVGFSCIQSATDGVRVCAPRAHGSCGCSAVGLGGASGFAGLASLAALVGLAFLRARRRLL